jgi:DNA end-binding protein Ku
MDHKLETAHISLGLNDHPGRHLFDHPGAGDSFQPAPRRLRQPHKQRRFFPTCNRDVEYDELVKGYEIAKDQYLQLMPSELKQLRAAESDSMQIVEFVPLTA